VLPNARALTGGAGGIGFSVLVLVAAYTLGGGWADEPDLAVTIFMLVAAFIAGDDVFEIYFDRITCE